MLVANRLTLTLAEYAQALPNGTVNIIGGGRVLIPTRVPVLFIAGIVQFGWNAISTPHRLHVEFLDDNGAPVVGDGGEPITATLDGISVAPAPGVPFGITLTVPIALPIVPPQLEPGTGYEFRATLDGETREDWSLSLMTTAEAQPKAA